MLKSLISRKHLCNTIEIDKFYNHLERAKNEHYFDCNYSWEIDHSGYFLHGKSSITYARQTDGHFFRLVKWFHPQDCEMMKDIYTISKDTGKFRVEKLLTYDIVEHEGHKWLYYETVRPNNELGLTGIEESVNVNTREFFFDFIDQVSVFLPYMASMSNKYGLGPSLTNLHFLSSREKDSVGHYWKNLKLFKYPVDEIIEDSKKKLIISVSIVEAVKNESTVLNDVLEYANHKWKL